MLGRAATLRVALAGSLLSMVAAHGCGARTPLGVADGVGPTDAFCRKAEYEAGSSEVSIYVLLDVSESMSQDEKWVQATAALAAFASSPGAAGLAMGLQYFPLPGSCDVSHYALPAVPVAPLPGNAAAIEASLAQHYPDWGDTPTGPALHGGLEYARALRLADPERAVLVALVTDGAPNACGSTTDAVAQLAAEGAGADPRVRTFVIGLETGYVADMTRIAEAGGTGEPVLIGPGPDAAQRIIEALEKVRATGEECVYAVPAVGDDHQAAAKDVTVVTESEDGAITEIDLVTNASGCGQAPGFTLDDPTAPNVVRLCPALCDAIHDHPGTKVRVIAGCGGDPSDDSVPKPSDDCDGVVSFQCVTKCGAGKSTLPVCENGSWRCPPGTVSNTSCTSCAPTPHGCCLPDGTLSEGACVDGAWTCPPGASLFGAPGCSPPEVCTVTLPCPLGSYCKVPDFSCGLGILPGSCAPVPTSCSDDDVQACGCDGQVHAHACAAAQSGADLSTEGCAEPPLHFRCGPLFCQTSSEICRTTLDLTVVLAPESFACIDASASCPDGCGCGACGPCPSGKVCTEDCTSDGAERHVSCTILGP